MRSDGQDHADAESGDVEHVGEVRGRQHRRQHEQHARRAVSMPVELNRSADTKERPDDGRQANEKPSVLVHGAQGSECHGCTGHDPHERSHLQHLTSGHNRLLVVAGVNTTPASHIPGSWCAVIGPRPGTFYSEPPAPNDVPRYGTARSPLRQGQGDGSFKRGDRVGIEVERLT